MRPSRRVRDRERGDLGRNLEPLDLDLDRPDWRRRRFDRDLDRDLDLDLLRDEDSWRTRLLRLDRADLSVDALLEEVGFASLAGLKSRGTWKIKQASVYH